MTEVYRYSLCLRSCIIFLLCRKIINDHVSECKTFIRTSEAATRINHCPAKRQKHSTWTMSLVLKSNGLARTSGSGSINIMMNEVGRIALSASWLQMIHLTGRILCGPYCMGRHGAFRYNSSEKGGTRLAGRMTRQSTMERYTYTDKLERIGESDRGHACGEYNWMKGHDWRALPARASAEDHLRFVSLSLSGITSCMVQ